MTEVLQIVQVSGVHVLLRAGIVDEVPARGGGAFRMRRDIDGKGARQHRLLRDIQSGEAWQSWHPSRGWQGFRCDPSPPRTRGQGFTCAVRFALLDVVIRLPHGVGDMGEAMHSHFGGTGKWSRAAVGLLSRIGGIAIF